MRIAIASDDGENIAKRASMAKYFYIFENEKKKEVVNNPYIYEGRGRGRLVANLLINKKIEMFIAEMVGENVKEILKYNNIKVIEMEGKIEDALNNILSQE